MSVVSHGHGKQVRRLLGQLAATGESWLAKVVLTHNQPDASLAEAFKDAPFELVERFNTEPAGFSANHNRAFADCQTPLFCVLNPDVELIDADIWEQLAVAASEGQGGCAYPHLLDEQGAPQDHERAAVTPLSLLRRHLLRLPDTRIDWVAAAFWVLPARWFRSLEGFDEAFFMYCEDTDFCLRLRLAGGRLVAVPARAVHHAGRRSRHEWRPFLWHLHSLWHLWTGPVLSRYRRAHLAE